MYIFHLFFFYLGFLVCSPKPVYWIQAHVYATDSHQA